MKVIFGIFLFLLCSSVTQAQEDEEFYKRVHKFKIGSTVKQCLLKGSLVRDTSDHDVLAGYEFRVVNKVNKDYIIRFLSWKNNPERNEEFGSMRSDSSSAGSQIKYFKLPVSEYALKAELALAKHAFTIGALTLPIKMRFGAKADDGSYKREFSFSGDISLGFSIGYKYSPSKRFGYNALTGISITSVPVSPATTKGTITNETNLAAITWHLGGLFEVDNFQIGTFIGIDYLAGEVGRAWAYRNKPWLGIGIGYSILQSKKTGDKQ